MYWNIFVPTEVIICFHREENQASSYENRSSNKNHITNYMERSFNELEISRSRYYLEQEKNKFESNRNVRKCKKIIAFQALKQISIVFKKQLPNDIEQKRIKKFLKYLFFST